MNKKGFTLVELLAVLVILTVIILIGSSSIAAIKNKINKNMFETKLDLMIAAAQEYGGNNKELFLNASGVATKKITKTVGDLIESNDLETSEYENKSTLGSIKCVKQKSNYSDGIVRCAVMTNPVDDVIVNNLKIRIYMEYNRVYACIIMDNTADGIANRKLIDPASSYNSSSHTWTNSEYSETNTYCK